VPRIVASTIVTSAISTLASSESRSDSDLKKVSYHCRLKPWKSCRERLELNENSTTRTIGANRKTKKRPTKTLRNRGRSKALGGPAGVGGGASAAAGGAAVAVDRDSTALTRWPPSPRAPRRAGRAA
jgi:hypothetical protein